MPFRTYIPLFFFLVALCIYSYYSTVGLSFPLSDPHGFRQAQTAITVYYFLQDGIRLDYVTPVMGSPWSIPMEFPLFQIIVAIFVKLTNTPLDPAGRLVSIFFFYSMLPIVYAILKNLHLPKNHRLVLLSFILICPTYLFWSRTFLIESLALTLSALYFFSVIKIHESQRKVIFIMLAIIVGMLATTVKITTFVLIIIPTLIYCLAALVKKIKTVKSSTAFLYAYKEIIIIITIIGVPILSSIVWILYADWLKSLNPLANGFMTSIDMNDWNYGTLSQKLSVQTLLRILNHIKNSVIGMPILILIPLFTFPLNSKYGLYSIVSLITFFLGPIIFTNLYAVHDYYYYANSIFLILAIGFSLLGTLSNIKYLLPARIILCIAFVILLFTTYKNTYFKSQSSPNYGQVEVGNTIKSYTQIDDVILIYGYVWSPEIPYYSQRRAIMDMWGLPLKSPKIEKSIQNVQKEKITAMFIRFYPDSFVKERIEYFNFSPNPVFINPWGILYVKK